jgi:hypothetical protein
VLSGDDLGNPEKLGAGLVGSLHGNDYLEGSVINVKCNRSNNADWRIAA